MAPVMAASLCGRASHLTLPRSFQPSRPAACDLQRVGCSSWQRSARRDNAAVLRRAALRAQAGAEASAQPTAATTTPAQTALTYTSYENNAWRVEFQQSGVKVLVDPWLVGRLEFAGQTWLYSGSKRVARPETIDVDRLAAETDFILLTQGLDDHAHRPTLKRLPKSLPVVGSPAAAQVALEFGYTSVTEVDHGQEVTVCDGRLRVRGTAGALVGPPWSKRENGFVLTEAATGVSVYYEPHCDFEAASVAGVGPVDVVVTPPCSQLLLGYALVKGATENAQLLGLLRPKVVIPLLNADIDQSGPLSELIEEVGSVAELEALLAATPGLQGAKVQVPTPAQPMPVVLN